MTAISYQGIICDFVVVNALRGTQATEAAVNQAIVVLRKPCTQADACRRRAGTPQPTRG